jgi:hypothetical protein
MENEVLFKCFSIESSFKDDFLEIVKEGECRLTVNLDKTFAFLRLKHLKEKIIYTYKHPSSPKLIISFPDS